MVAYSCSGLRPEQQGTLTGWREGVARTRETPSLISPPPVLRRKGRLLKRNESALVLILIPTQSRRLHTVRDLITRSELNATYREGRARFRITFHGFAIVNYLFEHFGVKKAPRGAETRKRGVLTLPTGDCRVTA